MALGALAPSARKDVKDESGLRRVVIDVVRHSYDNAPRSLQKRVGPSEVGTPCDRQLAFKMSGTKPSRGGYSDPWPSYVGTAVHTKLEESFIMDNERLKAAGKEPRWLTERRVTPGFGLTGSCDLFDTETGTVCDFKIVGNTSYLKYKKEGPSEVYRKQAHLYGLGYIQAGFTVNRVAIMFFGRAKTLQDLHVWSEPFDMTVALLALKRMKETQERLESGASPMSFEKNVGAACFFCEYKGCEDDGYCANGDE